MGFCRSEKEKILKLNRIYRELGILLKINKLIVVI